MTDPTQEQRARWLALAAQHNVTVSRDTADDVISLCAAITAEAAAAERSRVADEISRLTEALQEARGDLTLQKIAVHTLRNRVQQLEKYLEEHSRLD